MAVDPLLRARALTGEQASGAPAPGFVGLGDDAQQGIKPAPRRLFRDGTAKSGVPMKRILGLEPIASSSSVSGWWSL
jgi:hypothetical protein